MPGALLDEAESRACALAPDAVTAFALGAVSRLLGEAPGADGPRFFLAGGAFKTLLHGRPPRDLDLWAESPADRVRLVDLLRARGAIVGAPSAGADRFSLGGQEIEVSFQTEPMEPRLTRFDLGLSCIAVAFRAGALVPLVHPLAPRSAARQEVLLIQILFWQLALATLVRARRYAQDLGYRVSPGLESEVWSLFDARRREEQSDMIVQLVRHLGEATHGVPAEAARRIEG